MIKQGGGNIINNSSIIGLRGLPGASAYVVLKGAVTQLTRAMAREYIAHGIRVNAIYPGGIETPMVTEYIFAKSDNPNAVEEYFVSQHPIGRLGRPEEIARAVAFLTDDNVEFMTGSMLSVDGGWTAT
ncbi:MAG: SDR family oxidoreductase [Deltaproteobacteria bacterium]